MNTISLNELDKKLRGLLFTEELSPYVDKDVLHNGLQAWGKDKIATVGFGVSANLRLFELAKKKKCDALVVHHGISTQARALAKIAFDRYAWLIKNNVSLWSSHFLLDAHPVVGHPALILNTLGVDDTDPYMTDDAPWGRVGQLPKAQSLAQIQKTLTPLFSPQTVVYDFGPKEITTVVCATGKGAPYMPEMTWLMENNVDLFITGEVHEWNREEFREAGIHFIAGGHYHTEMFGVKKLQEIVSEWGVKTEWLDVPNEI